MTIRNKIWRIYHYNFFNSRLVRLRFYRWLSRKMYGKEIRVYNTRAGDTFITSCLECIFTERDPGDNCNLCADRYGEECENINEFDKIDSSCKLHFRIPIIFKIISFLLKCIAILWIIKIIFV